MRHNRSRWHRILRALGWALAAVMALVFPTEGFNSSHASLLRDHPVALRAAATDAYIDGFGGDPTVDYQFSVNGHTYTGSGTGGELGNGDVQRLNPGDAVSINYAADDPNVSCTCDARTAPDWRMPHGPYLNPWALLLLVPLILMLIDALRRRVLAGSARPLATEGMARYWGGERQRTITLNPSGADVSIKCPTLDLPIALELR